MNALVFLVHVLRSRWFALGLHACLWLLLYLVVINSGGRAPDFSEAPSSAAYSQGFPAISKLNSLLGPGQFAGPAPQTNALDPFFTRYFVPSPSPAPPPPTTRKIEVTYQGFYQTSERPKEVILKIADAFVTAKPGGMIATNLFVSLASMQTVTLTNLAAQTNILTLNVKKEIEVPLK